MRNVVAWNEINHFTQPTYKNPKAAAKFTTIARKVFKGGTVVAADILDQADNARAKRPTFRSATRYVKAFRKALQGPAQRLRRPQLLGHQPLPPDRHEGDHQGARLQADLAHRGRRPLQVRGLQGLPEPPAEGDEVHVQGRQGQTRRSSGSTSTRGSAARPPRFDAGLVGQRQAAQGLRRGAQARQVAGAPSMPRSPHRRHAPRGGLIPRRRPTPLQAASGGGEAVPRPLRSERRAVQRAGEESLRRPRASTDLASPRARRGGATGRPPAHGRRARSPAPTGRSACRAGRRRRARAGFLERSVTLLALDGSDVTRCGRGPAHIPGGGDARRLPPATPAPSRPSTAACDVLVAGPDGSVLSLDRRRAERDLRPRHRPSRSSPPARRCGG